MAAPLLYDTTGRPVPGINPDDALEILPVGSSTNRGLWLSVRRTGIGGSDVSTLVGLSKYVSRYELWEDKTGRTPLLVASPSEAATWGNLLEPVVRDEFARRSALEVRTAGTLRSQRWPWMLANPDGLCSDGAGYEGKTCSAWSAHEWGDHLNPLVPDHAELQAQWGMAVTGFKAWWVAGLIGGQNLAIRRVERDDELIAELVRISGEFWHENVLGGVEPGIDGSEACTRLLTDRYPVSDEDSIADIDAETRDELLAEREAATAAEKAAKAQVEAVKNRARQILGDAERLMCGDQEIATWKTTNKFKAAEFRKADPDLAVKYTRRVEVDEIDVEALQAAEPDTHRRYCSRVLQFKN